MKTSFLKIIFALTIATFFLAVPNNDVHAQSPRTFWVDHVSDGNGLFLTDCLQDNPCDVSTPQKFTSLMKALPENSTINFAAGTYDTYGFQEKDGSSANPTQSWWVKPGWKMVGVGIDQTILRLVGLTTDGDGAYVVGGRAYNELTDNFELSGMTLDANAQNQPNQTIGASGNNLGVVVFGVAVRGNNIHISNIRVKNIATRNANREAFGIISNSAHPEWGDSTGFILEHCTVDSVRPSVREMTLISVSGIYNWLNADGSVNNNAQGKGPGMMAGAVIRDCTVDGSDGGRGDGSGATNLTHGISLWGARGGIVENNTVRNVTRGFYMDSFRNESVTIRNNQFLDVERGMYLLLGGTPSEFARSSNVNFTGNTVRMAPDYRAHPTYYYYNGDPRAPNGQFLCGVCVGGGVGSPIVVDSINISGNTFNLKSGLDTQIAIIGILNQSVQNASINNNQFNLPPKNEQTGWPPYDLVTAWSANTTWDDTLSATPSANNTCIGNKDIHINAVLCNPAPVAVNSTLRIAQFKENGDLWGTVTSTGATPISIVSGGASTSVGTVVFDKPNLTTGADYQVSITKKTDYTIQVKTCLTDLVIDAECEATTNVVLTDTSNKLNFSLTPVAGKLYKVAIFYTIVPPLTVTEGHHPPTGEKLKPTEAIIEWETNNDGTSEVIYGKKSNWPQAMSADDCLAQDAQKKCKSFMLNHNLTKLHSLRLTDLVPNTTYRYKIISRDLNGVMAANDPEFTTPTTTPTTTPPPAGSDNADKNFSGYAWSSNIGWISFSCENDNSCASANYGVVKNDDGTLAGYAWSSNIGWIQFGGLSGFPIGGGTQSANASLSGNNLVGWARALVGSNVDGWDGWISLAGTGYGVTSTDKVHFRDYAWGSDVVGWINFDGVVGPPLPMSGTLNSNLSSCIIASGASACNVNLFWNVINPRGSTTVTSSYPSPNYLLAYNTNTKADVPIPGGLNGGSRTFFLKNDGESLVPTAEYPNGSGLTVTSSCIGGTHWDGAKCATNPISVSLTASPQDTLTLTNVSPTVSTTLTWTTTGNPTRCDATSPTGDWGGQKVTTGSNGGGSETKTYSIARRYNYTITCIKDSLSVSSSVAVEVNAVTPITVFLSVSPTKDLTKPADTVTLSWTTTGSPDSCSSSGPDGWTSNFRSVSGSGGSPVTLSNLSVGLHTYAITCVKSGAANAHSTEDVTINDSIMSGSLTSASPNCVIASGASSCNVSLNWTIDNPKASPTAITADGGIFYTVATTLTTPQSGTKVATLPGAVGVFSRIFHLYNNGQELNAPGGITATSNCAPNTAWDGSKCAAPVCPPGIVSLDTTTIDVGMEAVASAPAGFTAVSGSAFSKNGSTNVTLSGDTLTGVGAGTADISGTGWNNSNGAVNCTLSARTLTVTNARVNGACNPVSDGRSFTDKPTSNLCTSGNPTDPAGDGPWTWSCLGFNSMNATDANCSAQKVSNITYTVSGNAQNGGTISPTSTTVSPNATASFTITPNAGSNYVISSVTGTAGTGCDSGALAGNTYTTGPITANCTVTASFALSCGAGTDLIAGACQNRPTITATQASHGSITPNGSTSVIYGSDQSYTIDPANGYNVSSLIIDGATISGATSYLFSNVTINHTISATFTASACANEATNPPTCNVCTAGSAMVGGQCTPVTVSVTASTPYNTTPNTNVSFAYTSTTNYGSTECHLVNFNKTVDLTTSYQASGPIIFASESSEGAFGYYVQCRNSTITSTTAYSDLITVNTACSTGNHWNGTSCVSDSVMSGTLTATSCSIVAGANSCNVTLSWSTAHPVGTSGVRSSSPNADFHVSNPDANSGSVSVPITYPFRTFYLYNNQQSLVPASESPNGSGLTVSVDCVSGTVWSPSQNKCLTTLVHGVCDTTHYSCFAGTNPSGSSVGGTNVDGANAWTWNCDGLNGGNNVSCSETKPTPVAGGWSDWGACSQSCGGGTQTRLCNKPAPENGGSLCSADADGGSVRACNTQACGNGGRVNGLCTPVDAAVHYGCFDSDFLDIQSKNDGANTYTWTCKGKNNGEDALCSEAKSPTCEDTSAINFGETSNSGKCEYIVIDVPLCDDSKANNNGSPAPCTYNAPDVCNDPQAKNFESTGACTYDTGKVCNNPFAQNWGQALPCKFPKKPVFIEN